MNVDKLKSILSCNICRAYFAQHLENPIRCGGIEYNEKGEKITLNGTLWSEIVKKHEENHEKRRLEFYEKHKEHIDYHGYFNNSVITTGELV